LQRGVGPRSTCGKIGSGGHPAPVGVVNGYAVGLTSIFDQGQFFSSDLTLYQLTSHTSTATFISELGSLTPIRTWATN